jgi:isoleucyl-tRNA synthetase
LITESFPGQFRNWFYSYLTMGTALAQETPTKNIFSYALVRDESGAEMHKSQGNAIWFDDAAEDIGVDVIRWLYARQNPENNLRFGTEITNEIRRQVIIPLWNIYSFFTNYAILDKFTPPKTFSEPKSKNLMDQWILTEVKETTDDVKNHLTLYQPDKAALAIENFINLLSNWYIRRNRRRFWKSGDFENNQIDDDKFSAYETLYFVLVTLSKIMSPMIPFITEEIYTNLTKDTKWGKESVHLEDFPFFKTKSLDESELQIATRAAMRISSLGRSARSKTKIKVRQPINNLYFKTKETITSKYIEMILDQVSDEVNVKNVKHVNKNYQLSNILIKPNNSILGPRIGSKIGKLNNEIQSLNHNELYKELLIHDKIIILDIEITLEDLHIEHTNLDNSEFIEDNNFEVSIETKLDNNLIEEGISREIIHNIQNLRKNSGFNISDKISMFYYGDEKIEKVIEKYQTHMSEEILATKIMKCESKRGSNIKFKINNSTISINIELS